MPDHEADLYRVLQVDPAADPDVVQAAYRVLARKLHPDLVGDEAAMKRLNAAWEVLGDAEQRARYDRDRGPAQSPRAAEAGPAAARAKVADHAGPPPGSPSGSVLSFGRYEGWSLGEIARVDPDFLEWLSRVPAGRGFRDELDPLLRSMPGSRSHRSGQLDGRPPEQRGDSARR